MALQNKKSLGQHWLKDPDVLADIADAAELTPDDTVLEIGPGLGTLTSRLLARAGRVIAVEFDAFCLKPIDYFSVAVVGFNIFIHLVCFLFAKAKVLEH